MSVNTLILKLDDAANTAAYNEALLYFESLGFKGKTASDLAIEKVHNNVLFDAGTLPEINVTAKAWGNGDDASRRENYQKARKTKRKADEKVLQHEMNQSIRNATNKWGSAIGTGVEIASGFTPLWWVSPAVRTGLDLSKGNYKGAALNAGLAFAAPYAIGKGIQYISPYAKSAILASKLNRLIKNTKLDKPLEKLNLLDGYLFHNGHVEVRPAGYNGKKYTYILREAKPGALKIEEGKYKSVRRPYKDNPDLIWWDTKGHNYGKKVYVTKLGNDATHVMSNMEDLPISQFIERYEPSYYVTKLKPVNSVIDYTFDPISGASIPHMPGKVLNNKMSYEEILTHPVLLRSKSTPTKTSLAFFERLPSKISEAERLGIPKGERNLPSKEGYAFIEYTPASKSVGPFIKDIVKATSNAISDAQSIAKNEVILSQLEHNNKLAARIYGNSLGLSSYPRYQNILYKIIPREELIRIKAGIHNNYSDDWNTVGGYWDYTNKELIVTKNKDGTINPIIPYHEGLHSIRYGLLADPRLTKLKILKIIDPSKSNIKHNNYYFSNIEAPVHYLLVGKLWGVPIGASYPGKLAVLELIFKNGINGTPYYTKLNTDRDYKRFWDAITGVYFKSGGSIKIKKKNKGKFAKVRDYVNYKNNK